MQSWLPRPPLRVVNFELDPESAEVLRKFPGFEDFDPMTEVLLNIRPGTGNVDAPRCFGMKLDQAFEKFGAVSCVHDRHVRVRKLTLNIKSSRGLTSEFNFTCTDHVDDIKVGCREGTFLEFNKECFEDVFGKGELEIARANFRNCGIQHKRTDIGYELSQHTYISALKPIRDTELTGMPNEQKVDVRLARLFIILLKALAYCLQTREDLAHQASASACLSVHEM